MKPIIVAVVALLAGVGRVMAADMPVPQAAPVPPPVYFPTYYNWSGIYLGVNGGYGFGQSNWTNAGVSTGNFNINGFLVGGTLGANYQTGSYLVGFEGDIDWSSVQGTVPSPPALPSEPLPAQPAKPRAPGWALRALGWVMHSIVSSFSAPAARAFSGLQAFLNPGGSISAGPSQLGWTAGAGVEYAFTDAVSAKVEYLFVNLGTVACPTSTGCGPFASHSFSFSENLVRAGVNYRFSW